MWVNFSESKGFCGITKLDPKKFLKGSGGYRSIKIIWQKSFFEEATFQQTVYCLCLLS